MKEIKLKSGAVLAMQLASFEDGMALLDAILKETIGVPIGDPEEGFDLQNALGKDLSQIKDVLFKVISSKMVKDALWVCVSSCTYASPDKPTVGIRIDKTTFQSEETRADFFPVAGEVVAFNLAPFFKNLSLPSSLQEALAAKSAKSPGPATG